MCVGYIHIYIHMFVYIYRVRLVAPPSLLALCARRLHRVRRVALCPGRRLASPGGCVSRRAPTLCLRTWLDERR